MKNFIWEDFTNPILNRLKNENDLIDLINSSDDDYDAQLKLKVWSHTKLNLGTPSKDYSNLSSIDILEDAKNENNFYCTQFAQLYIQSATALGWYSRKLGIDSDHNKDEEDMHHGISDIWSNKFKKWYAVDPMHNLHFEKNDIPLNALEVRLEYIKNYAADIFGIIGNRKEKIKFSKDNFGFDTPSNYFWFFISQRNNFFEKPGIFNTKAYLFVDEFNNNKTWFKDGKKHPMYTNQFIKTNDVKVIFPKIL